MKQLLFGSRSKTVMTLFVLAFIAFAVSYAVDDYLPGDIAAKIVFFFVVLTSVTGFVADVTQIAQGPQSPKPEPSPVPNIELKPQFTFQVSPPEIVAPTPAIPALDKPAPIAPAPRTILPDGKRITGSIRPELLDIPMSGREQDVVKVLEHLQKYPTTIEGIGGLGKSRLAVAVIMNDAISSAVWLVADEFTSADDVLILLREHFDLPIDADRRTVLDLVRRHVPLIVIDNAEAITVERRQDYVRLIEEIDHTGAKVLLTSRVAWSEIKLKRNHTPTQLSPEDAATVVVNMAQTFGVPYDLRTKADEFASASRLHPRLMEWGIRQMIDIFSPDEVIRELKALKSPEIEDALDEMIGLTIRQMTARHGADAEATLRKLNVFRGGFTLEAARSVTGLDDAALNSQLRILVPWQFIRRREDVNDQTRYEVEPLVYEVVGEDKSQYESHCSYFSQLARDHNDREDYFKLDIEADNLEVAFDRMIAVKNAPAAYWLANAIEKFQENRLQFRQRLEWMQRLATIISEDDDPRLLTGFNNSYGNALKRLSKIEDSENNLYRSIEKFEIALRYTSPDVDMYDYAAIKAGLGTAYFDLATVKDHEHNLLISIDHFKEALAYIIPENSPIIYSSIQNNLGNAYRSLSEIKDHHDNTKRAILALEESVRFRNPERFPLAYSSGLHNLANVYIDLAKFEDRRDNLAKAVSLCEESLLYLTPTSEPLGYATSKNTLGTAFCTLAEIDNRLFNLRKGVDAYRDALIYRIPTHTPIEYATTKNNLATALVNLAALENTEENLNYAIAAYLEVLQFHTPEVSPISFALAKTHLGHAYSQLSRLVDRKKNLYLAIQAHQDGIKVISPNVFPLIYARLQNNLAGAFSMLGNVEDKEKNFVLAIKGFEEALRYFDPKISPYEYAAANRNLAAIQYELGYISEAVLSLSKAEKCFRQTDFSTEADQILEFLQYIETKRGQ